MAGRSPGPWDADDIARIRANFAAYRNARYEAGPIAFLDGAGGTQTPDAVVGAVKSYLEDSNANIDGAFPTSVETDELIETAREVGADFLGSRSEEIVLGANTTTLNFLLTRAFARTMSPGEEILVTCLDHDANISPWLAAAQDFGLQVRFAPLLLEDGTLDLDAARGMVGPRTRVISFPLASNTTGTIVDPGPMVELARQAGAITWADGVHYACHRLVDREAIGLDVVLTSPYKYCGPHMGVAAIRADLAASLPAERVRPADERPVGHRFETGTQNHEALAGFVASAEYFASLPGVGGTSRREQLGEAFARIRDHEQVLGRRALTQLQDVEDIVIYGISDPERVAERTATIAFTHKELSQREVATRMAEAGIYVNDGDHYGLETMRAYGLESSGGMIRASFVHYNDEHDVDRLVEAIVEL